jgi:hypothetical protein
MIDIFTQYAELAYRTEEGCKNPPAPKMPLKQVFEKGPPEMDFEEAVDHFIQDHQVPEDKISVAREQFEKLYDAGVIQFEALIDVVLWPWRLESTKGEMIVGLSFLVWDGTQYVNANTLLADEEMDDDRPIV